MAEDICNVILGSLRTEEPADVRLVIDLALDAYYEFQPLAEVEILVPEHLKEVALMAVPTLKEGAEGDLGVYRGAQFTESVEEIELTIRPFGGDDEA